MNTYTITKEELCLDLTGVIVVQTENPNKDKILHFFPLLRDNRRTKMINIL